MKQIGNTSVFERAIKTCEQTTTLPNLRLQGHAKTQKWLVNIAVAYGRSGDSATNIEVSSSSFSLLWTLPETVRPFAQLARALPASYRPHGR